MNVVLSLLCLAAFVYQLVVLATILVSWFPIEPGSALESVARALRSATDPVLGPLRRTIPALQVGGFAIDLSPIILLIGLQILQAVLC